MPENPMGETQPRSRYDLATYLAQVDALPQPTRKDENHREILEKILFILDNVVDLIDSNKLQFTEGEMDDFQKRIKKRRDEIPSTDKTIQQRTRMDTLLRKIDGVLDWRDAVVAKDDAFTGSEREATSEHMFLDAVKNLRNRTLNEGHQKELDRGGNKSEIEIKDITVRVNTVRLLVTYGSFRGTQEQISDFEEALTGWLSEIKGIDEKTLKANQLDKKSLEKLLTEMRQKGKRD